MGMSKLSKPQQRILQDMLLNKWYDGADLPCKGQTLQALEDKGFIKSEQIRRYNAYTPRKWTHRFMKIKEAS